MNLNEKLQERLRAWMIAFSELSLHDFHVNISEKYIHVFETPDFEKSVEIDGLIEVKNMKSNFFIQTIKDKDSSFDTVFTLVVEPLTLKSENNWMGISFLFYKENKVLLEFPILTEEKDKASLKTFIDTFKIPTGVGTWIEAYSLLKFFETREYAFIPVCNL